MKNLTKILVENNKLQTAIDYLIDEIKNQFEVNLNNCIVSDEKLEEIKDFSLEVFNEYEVYDDKLFELADALNQQGYNILEKSIEFDEKSILIVNESLREYVLDQIIEHQEQMKKSFEKDNQTQFNLER